MRWQLRLWLLRKQLYGEWSQFWRFLAAGAWLVVGDMLWQLPAYRAAYYAYREEAWHTAHAALDFPAWLRNGGWRLRTPHS